MNRYPNRWRTITKKVDEPEETALRAIVFFISEPLIEKYMISFPQTLLPNKTTN